MELFASRAANGTENPPSPAFTGRKPSLARVGGALEKRAMGGRPQ